MTHLRESLQKLTEKKNQRMKRRKLKLEKRKRSLIKVIQRAGGDTTLETRGEDVKLHSKRVNVKLISKREKIKNHTRNECKLLQMLGKCSNLSRNLGVPLWQLKIKNIFFCSK